MTTGGAAHGKRSTALITPDRLFTERSESPAATPKTSANPTDATVQTTVWKKVCQKRGSLTSDVKLASPMNFDELAPSIASVRLNLSPSMMGIYVRKMRAPMRGAIRR